VDAHGCKPSAGTRWSELRGGCIQPFTEGVRIDGTKENTRGSAAYVVFATADHAPSANASVELFTTEGTVVLARGANGEYTKSGNAFTVNPANGWFVKQGAEVAYGTAPKAEPAVGGDVDANGCKPSAGYTWSPLRKECIRTFEKGLRLDPVPAPKGSDAVISAFLVFATDDQSEAKNESIELHVAGAPAPVLLTRKPKTKTFVNDAAGFTASFAKVWELSKGKTVVFRAAPAAKK
jgi:hypothetical protein